jgi:hypothetical protein
MDGPQSRPGCSGRKENHLLLPGIELRQLVGILTDLSALLYNRLKLIEITRGDTRRPTSRSAASVGLMDLSMYVTVLLKANYILK